MRSLRLKLVLVMVILIVAVTAVVGAFLINGVSSFYTDQFFTQMSASFTRDYITELNAASSAGPERLKETAMASSGLNIDISTRNVYILDENGVLLTGSDESVFVEVSPNIITAISGAVGQSKGVAGSYMDIAVPVSDGESSYIIYIRDNRDTADELASQILRIIVPALLLGLVISVVLSFLLADIVIRPISELTNGTRRVASGDFSMRIDVHAKDEIGVLTENFNDMARILKATLDEVENEKNKLNTLFLHMSDGVVAFSRGGELIHFNPAATQMLGVDFSNSPTYDEIFGENAPISDALGLTRSESLSRARRVGERDLELYIAPFMGEGAGGVLVVIHDVTEQKRTDDVRREFVSNVSHELRTPLTNIKSYTETLIDADGSLDPATNRKFLGVILSETDRTTRIVKDLLTLSRFDYGRMEMNYTDFDLGKCVREVFEAVLLDAKNHGHDMHIVLPNELPIINGDKERLQQVFLNIISNSIKYTPDGGRIELSAGAGSSTVWVSVRDSGIGIPENDIPRLFDRFYRVDKARSRQSGGTGLGLSIAREIVSLHGGEIEVLSKLGEGTRVTVTLPIEGVSHE